MGLEKNFGREEGGAEICVSPPPLPCRWDIGKSEEICGKYGNYAENMKEYVANTWKIYGTEKNPNLSTSI